MKMADILHKTRAPGTNIKSSAVWAEAHEVENGAITADMLEYPMYFFVKSGASPITFAHGIGKKPTGVVATPNALQPYAWSYDADATNITIYHNAFGSLTFSIIAWV